MRHNYNLKLTKHLKCQVLGVSENLNVQVWPRNKHRVQDTIQVKWVKEHLNIHLGIINNPNKSNHKNSAFQVQDTTQQVTDPILPHTHTLWPLKLVVCLSRKKMVRVLVNILHRPFRKVLMVANLELKLHRL